MKSVKLSIAILIMLIPATIIFAGCERPRVDSADYVDPIEDVSAFEPAEEFEYLVNIGPNIDNLRQNLSDKPGVAENEVNQGFDEAINTIGLAGIEQVDATAEANDRMVHAHGVYRFADGENILGGLSEAGVSEVTLPAKFATDRRVTHMTIANPGNLLELTFSQMSDEDLMGLMFLGIQDPEEIYGWMGNEAVVLTLVNPDFDPRGEETPQNTAFHSVLAIQSDSPGDGFELVENMYNFWGSHMSMIGMKMNPAEITEIEGYEALVIEFPEMDPALLQDMMPEGEEVVMEPMAAFVAIVIDDYLFMGDEYSIQNVIGSYNKDVSGTGRMANIEMEVNWDRITETFIPSAMGLIPALMLTADLPPGIQDLLQRVYDEFQDFDVIGTSRGSLLVQDGENFEVDILTSRESIRFLRVMTEIVEETPETVWEDLGKIIGGAIADQFGGGMGMPGMGGFGGPGGGTEQDGGSPADGDYSFDFEKS